MGKAGVVETEQPAGPITRVKVTELEDVLRTLPPADMPVTHHFSHGVYGRELFIPAGTVLTGKIHKFSSMNVLLSGEIAVLTQDGTVKRVTQGYVEIAPPGMKRVGYAITDTRWLTVHGTHETDLAAIEEEFIAQDEQEFLSFCQTQLLKEK